MKLVNKSALLLSTVLVGFTPLANAQVLDDTDTDVVDLREEELLEELVEGDGIDEIVVTGSRTRRPDLTTAFPTLVVGEELLEKNAFTNIGDALNQIPAFGNGIDATGGQGANIGVNFTDFLNLGSQRTLTLVNGRRFVSSNVISSGSESGSQVDVSVIPIGLIERIETIGVGGAPTYGSDAIAGTVNIILRDDFEGVDARIQYGETQRGDLDSEQYSVLVGANTDDGRGNVTFNVEYTDSDGLDQLDRPGIYVDEPFDSQIEFGTEGFGNVPIPSSFNLGVGGTILDANGREVTIDANGDGFFDGISRPFNLEGGNGENVQLFTNGGVVSPTSFFVPSCITDAAQAANGTCNFLASNGITGELGGVFYGFQPDGTLGPLQNGQFIPGQSIFFAQGGFENDFFAQVGQLVAPVQRVNFGSTFKYDLADWIAFKGDFQATNINAIEGVNQGGFQTFAFGGLQGPLEIPTANPFLSNQARDILASNGIGSDDTFFLSRFNNDIVNQGSRNSETSLYRIAAGFDGDFRAGSRDFYYNINAVIGETNNEQQSSVINDRRFLNAVDAVIDPATGEIVCRVTLEGEPDLVGSGISALSNDVTDCVPLNLFGEGVASQEALEFVTQTTNNLTDINQSIFSAYFGGDVFELPGGVAQFVLGYETRKESIDFQRDSGAFTGVGRTAASPNADGSFVTNEYFGELYIPVVSPDLDVPFVNSLEVGGQVREIVNSLAGDFTAWTVEGTYQPVEDIVLRGNITRSLRAPSLVELFQPQQTTFSFGRDPCDQRFIEEGPNRAANCASDGLPAGFTSDIANASRPGLTGGNPNLINETADAYTVGAVLQPRWVPGLVVQADYLNIELEDEIAIQSLTNNLETCYDADPSDFPNLACGSFTRDSDGQIIDFLTGQLNADSFETQFLNIRADYDFDVVDAFNVFGGNRVGDYGSFSIDAQAFHVIQRDRVVANVAAPSTVGGFFDPEWSGTLDGTYQKNGLRLFWRAIWQDNSLFSSSGRNFFANEEGEVIKSLGWNWLHNASISYDFSELLPSYDRPIQVQLNVNNVFNDSPGRGLRRIFNDFYDSEIYGRSYSVVLRASF